MQTWRILVLAGSGSATTIEQHARRAALAAASEILATQDYSLVMGRPCLYVEMAATAQARDEIVRELGLAELRVEDADREVGELDPDGSDASSRSEGEEHSDVQ